MACSDLDSAVAILDLRDPGAPGYFFSHDAVPLDISFSPAGAELAITTSDNAVHVLRPEPGDDAEIPRHPQPVRSVAFDGSGDVVATASSDGWVRVFRLGAGDAPPDLLRTSRLSLDAPALALSDDGRTALVASGDRTARLFRLSTDDLRAALAKANADCLRPDLRRSFLGEAAGDAEKVFLECEQSAGR